jgi:hypothetical protein
MNIIEFFINIVFVLFNVMAVADSRMRMKFVINFEVIPFQYNNILFHVCAKSMMKYVISVV